MSRLAAAFLAAVFMLLLVAPRAMARDIEPGFRQFEMPNLERLPDRCRTDAVLTRRAELYDAKARLDRKIERMERAAREIKTAMAGPVAAGRRQSLLRDAIDLQTWLVRWRYVRSIIEEQIENYSALPPCPATGPGRASGWTNLQPGPGDTSATPYVPDCVSPIGQRDIQPYLDRNRQLADWLKQAQDSAVGKMGSPGTADALETLIQDMAAAEDEIRRNNRAIKAIAERNPCERPAPRQGAMVTPNPPLVPMDECEAAMLAALNRARSDPAAYGETFRRARGASGEETRDFFVGRTPVGTLVADPRLMAAAKAHAEEIAARDVVGHVGADGSGPLARFQRQGIYVTMAAELISIGKSDAIDALNTLVLDQGNPGGPHRKDVFNGSFTLVGIACVETLGHGRIIVIDLSNPPMQRDE
jgi:hypothetical protein